MRYHFIPWVVVAAFLSSPHAVSDPTSIEVDTREFVNLYSRVGFDPSLFFLAEKVEVSRDNEWRAAANNGSAAGAFLNGLKLYFGIGADAAEKEGLSQLERAALDDHGPAQVWLAYVLLLSNEHERAREWISRASESGEPGSDYLSALLLTHDGDPQGAILKLNEAAEEDFLPAQIDLVLRYIAMGNYAGAKTWAERLDAHDVPFGAYVLGLLYGQGTLGEKNHSVSFRYFDKAAEMEFPDAIFYRGYCYTHGLGVESNQVAAIADFKQALELGSQMALQYQAHLRQQGDPPNLLEQQPLLTEEQRAHHRGMANVWNELLEKSRDRMGPDSDIR